MRVCVCARACVRRLTTSVCLCVCVCVCARLDRYLDIVFALVFQVFVMHEQITVYSGVGALLVCCGAVSTIYVVYRERKP